MIGQKKSNPRRGETYTQAEKESECFNEEARVNGLQNSLRIIDLV